MGQEFRGRLAESFLRRLEGIVLEVVMNDRIVVESKVIDDFQICNSCADIFFRLIFLHSLNWNKNSNRGKRWAGSKPCRQ
jgi:hypothetical protein